MGGRHRELRSGHDPRRRGHPPRHLRRQYRGRRPDAGIPQPELRAQAERPVLGRRFGDLRHAALRGARRQHFRSVHQDLRRELFHDRPADHADEPVGQRPRHVVRLRRDARPDVEARRRVQPGRGLHHQDVDVGLRQLFRPVRGRRRLRHAVDVDDRRGVPAGRGRDPDVRRAGHQLQRRRRGVEPDPEPVQLPAVQPAGQLRELPRRQQGPGLRLGRHDGLQVRRLVAVLRRVDLARRLFVHRPADRQRPDVLQHPRARA